MKTARLALITLLLTPPAWGVEPITGPELLSHITIIADDSMEGRGTGSPGERRAALYVAEQFRKIGLRPGNGDSYVQEVPMTGITADPSAVVSFESPKGTVPARYFDEFAGGSGVAEPSVSVDADLVFAGYGITAPDQTWDDFKGVDVRGKVLLVLVNDPPSADPRHFGGRAMTYYGRWTYKYEEAARHGAAGVILIHMDDLAGYPWQVVQKSWTGERFQLRDDVDPLLVRGWIRRDIAEEILRNAGKKLQDLLEAAARPDFRPIDLRTRVKTRFDNKVRELTAPNVVGILPGKVHPDRYLCVVAHHDHFGIGKPDETGDSIYNGALDNATGVAAVIACARVLEEQGTSDSVVFMTVTAEEQNLLGSEYYTLHPLVPLELTTAAFALDGLSVLGRTKDVTAIGAEQNGLKAIVDSVAAEQGLTVSPDLFPERGYFFRSDHFSFARAGVPAISVNLGSDYVGRPAGWGEEKENEYIRKHYHQPSDEVGDDWDMSGVVQIAEFWMKLVFRIGEEKDLIPWAEGSEYRRRLPLPTPPR